MFILVILCLKFSFSLFIFLDTMFHKKMSVLFKKTRRIDHDPTKVLQFTTTSVSFLMSPTAPTPTGTYLSAGAPPSTFKFPEVRNDSLNWSEVSDGLRNNVPL
jgi:hypothetical protein